MPAEQATSHDHQRSPRCRTSLHRLFSFQLRRLNLLYSRASVSIYGREFGMTLTEWRLFAELHATAQERVAFGYLTQQTGLDAGLASRTVDALQNKDLVMRLVNERDARLRDVSLTDTGRLLGHHMLARVRQRNRQLLSRLSTEDRAALPRIMTALIDEATQMLAQETSQTRHPAPENPRRSAR